MDFPSNYMWKLENVKHENCFKTRINNSVRKFGFFVNNPAEPAMLMHNGLFILSASFNAFNLTSIEIIGKLCYNSNI